MGELATAAAPSPAVEPAPMAEVPAPPALEPRLARKADLYWAAGVLAALGAVFAFIKLLPGLAVPVLIAFALAYILDPVVDKLEARGMGRTAAVAALFGAGFVIGIAGIVFLVPVLAAQASRLPGYLQDAAVRALPRIEGMVGRPLPHDLRELFNELGGKFGEQVPNLLPRAADIAASALGGTAALLSTLAGLLLIPIVSFYFLRDYDRIWSALKAVLPATTREHVAGRVSQIDVVVGAFVRGQLTVAAILSVLYSIALTLAGLDLAIAVGIATGIGNLIPYVGIAIGILLSTALSLIQVGTGFHLLAVLLAFVAVMVTDIAYITPRVVGTKVGLSPVAVILGVLAFGSLFGFAGVLVAVPATAALKVVAKVMIERWRESRWYSGEQPAS